MQRSRHDSGILVLRPDGPSLDADSSTGLKDALRDQIAAGELELCVDLDDVESMDSTGLGVLIGAFRQLGGRGTIRLSRVSPSVRTLLEMTQIRLLHARDREVHEQPACLRQHADLNGQRFSTGSSCLFGGPEPGIENLDLALRQFVRLRLRRPLNSIDYVFVNFHSCHLPLGARLFLFCSLGILEQFAYTAENLPRTGVVVLATESGVGDPTNESNGLAGITEVDDDTDANTSGFGDVGQRGFTRHQVIGNRRVFR